MATVEYDRQAALKAFFDSKTGVKGLVDSGVKTVPEMFICDPEITEKFDLSVPVIDIGGGDGVSRASVVEKIGSACESWGFFQVVNHGVPLTVMNNMIDAVRAFHEQDTEKKISYCNSDPNVMFKYNTGSFEAQKMFMKRPVIWHDAVFCVMGHLPPDLKDVPLEFRGPLLEYTKSITALSTTLYGLLSEALGLETDHLKDMGCAEGMHFVGHYYPPCPEPEKTLGSFSHTDSPFMNLLLQDQSGGLQVLHSSNQWVDVPPLRGALVVNVGDLMQIITNDRFKSTTHRVVLSKNNINARISMASFMGPITKEALSSQVFRPIKELLSEENPAVYKETTSNQYTAYHYPNIFNNVGHSTLQHFKL